MATVRVRAEQTTVDWEQGAEFAVERTPFLDMLIADGRLTVLEEVGDLDSDGETVDAGDEGEPAPGADGEAAPIKPVSTPARRRGAQEQDDA
ncbi:hypothetical protein ACWFRB_09195 [Rhodococcus sp. NPDC055112]